MPCVNAACPSYDFRCAMGLCLREEVYCNGTVECPDGSDEPLNCRSKFLVFTAHGYISVVYAVVLCLSVLLSQASIVSKRLNVGSRKTSSRDAIVGDMSP